MGHNRGLAPSHNRGWRSRQRRGATSVHPSALETPPCQLLPSTRLGPQQHGECSLQAKGLAMLPTSSSMNAGSETGPERRLDRGCALRVLRPTRGKQLSPGCRGPGRRLQPGPVPWPGSPSGDAAGSSCARREKTPKQQGRPYLDLAAPGRQRGCS